MNTQPYLVEMALLLIVFFVIGGAIGYYARRWFGAGTQADAPKAPAVAAVPDVAPATTTEATSSEPVPATARQPATAQKAASTAPATPAETPPAAAKKPAARTSSGRKPAAKKAAAKKPAAEQAAAPKKATATKPAARKTAASSSKKAASAAPSESAPAAATAETPAGSKPQMLTAPRSDGKDDLKKIKGIGPKLESKLNEMGVYHFDQIAAWDRGAVAWVDAELSFKGRIDREQWISQAKTLSA